MEDNGDEFHCTAKQLDDPDFIVLNAAFFPDELQHGQSIKMTQAMPEQADAIYLLNTSKGTRAEADVLRPVAGCRQRHHYPATVTAAGWFTVNRESARFVHPFFQAAHNPLIARYRQYQIRQKY